MKTELKILIERANEIPVEMQQTDRETLQYQLLKDEQKEILGTIETIRTKYNAIID